MQIFSGNFLPDENKRYRFRAKGAAAAKALAQLVYNGVSTIFYKSSAGYTDIRDSYMTWVFHAPQNFKTAAGGDTLFNCDYIASNELTLSGFFQALAAATQYYGDYAQGVEVAGWESAMRTLQLAEDRVNSELANASSVKVLSESGGSFGEIWDFGTFEAPTGTTNLFSSFVRRLDSMLRETEGSQTISGASAGKFIVGKNKLVIVLDFQRRGSSVAKFRFSFEDYAEG